MGSGKQSMENSIRSAYTRANPLSGNKTINDWQNEGPERRRTPALSNALRQGHCHGQARRIHLEGRAYLAGRREGSARTLPAQVFASVFFLETLETFASHPRFAAAVIIYP